MSIVSVGILIALPTAGCSNMRNPFEKQPIIQFEPEYVDLGKVEEGQEIKTAFTIKNGGHELLKIHEAHSSCGCTVPKLKVNEVKPGETTTLDITVDTSMKQGAVVKTVDVSSNDPITPVVALSIKLDVNNRHEGMTESGRIKIFTDEKCTSCHVDRGVGLGGKDLFEADCAMCHGATARGAVGGALIYGNYNDPKYENHIRDVISYGSKTHKSMPGFLDTAGGPLIKEQIDSLLVYLKQLSEAEKAKTGVKTERPTTGAKTEGQTTGIKIEGPTVVQIEGPTTRGKTEAVTTRGKTEETTTRGKIKGPTTKEENQTEEKSSEKNKEAL